MGCPYQYLFQYLSSLTLSFEPDRVSFHRWRYTLTKASVAIALTLFLALGGVSLWAQSQNTAQIQGTVLDASGSAVPGAEIKATQTDTGVVRIATSGAHGGYVLANLPIGPYRLEVSKPGFSHLRSERNRVAGCHQPDNRCLTEGRRRERTGAGGGERDSGGIAGHRPRNRDGKPAHFGIAAQRPRGDRPDPIYAWGDSPGRRRQRRLPRHRSSS